MQREMIDERLGHNDDSGILPANFQSKSIFEAMKEYDDNQILRFLQEIENQEGRQEELMKMIKWTHPDANREVDCTLLHLALYQIRSKEVVFKLMDIGGKQLVMKKNNYGCTALYRACQNKNVSVDIVSKLLEVGGKELLMVNDQSGSTALHYACHNENLSVDIVSKLLEVGGKELAIMVNNGYRCTALHYACQNKNVSVDIVSKLLEVGGKELAIMVNNGYRWTALQLACKNENVSVDIVSKLLEVGGLEVLMNSDGSTSTALHNACENKNISVDIVSTLLELGGRELVMRRTGDDDWTALHCACRNENISLDIISMLVDLGGWNLLMLIDEHGENHMEDRYIGYSALHCACQNTNISVDIISKLLDVGDWDLAIMTYEDGLTALHCACENPNVSVDVISKLLEVGGSDILEFYDDDGYNPLYFGYFKSHNAYANENFNDSFTFLVKQCILKNIGGEFGIGGLFNTANEERIQDKIYEKWTKLSPALRSAVESLQEECSQQPPILHAAILAKAPLHVIQDIVTQFEYSVLQPNSLNQYPLVVALEKGLDWNKGLQQITEATAVAQEQRKVIYTAAQYGLKWTNHMKELAKANADEMCNSGHDSLTGLRVFMVAAMGDYHDLSAIYGMMKMSPEIRNTV